MNFSSITDPARFTRVGHLEPFALPGGDGAARQPARIALDLLHRAGIEWTDDLAPVGAVGDAGLHILAQQISRDVGLRADPQHGPAVRRGRQPARRLSAGHLRRPGGRRTRAPGPPAATRHQLAFGVDGALLDPAPLIAGLVAGLRAGVDVADLAAGFHAAVIEPPSAAADSVARRGRISRRSGSPAACSSTAILLDGFRKALSDNGFDVLTHEVLPCNDGGIALGQAVIAAASTRSRARERRMCLGIPGKVVDIWDEAGTRMSTVDFGGTTKTVCLAYLPDMEIGEYTIVHAGFAIARLDEESANETLKMFADLGVLEEELAGDQTGRRRRGVRHEVPGRVP